MPDSCPPPGTVSVNRFQVGPVEILVTWTADATSVKPLCNGTVTHLTATNTGTARWSASIPVGRNAAYRTVTLDPGQTVDLNQAQCRNRGYEFLLDSTDLLLTLG